MDATSAPAREQEKVDQKSHSSWPISKEMALNNSYQVIWWYLARKSAMSDDKDVKYPSKYYPDEEQNFDTSDHLEHAQTPP